MQCSRGWNTTITITIAIAIAIAALTAISIARSDSVLQFECIDLGTILLEGYAAEVDLDTRTERPAWHIQHTAITITITITITSTVVAVVRVELPRRRSLGR
jgi:hypothetical protein